jgi:hypothetical protein
MKLRILLAILLVGAKAFSADQIESSIAKKFHLLNMRCESKISDGLETTPQSPPLDIDDPGTPGCNKWEVNVLLTGDITQDDKGFELPLFDLNYGIGDNLQLKYEVPIVRNQSDDSTVSGVGDSKVGVKFNFFEDEESETTLAVYPQLSFVTPNSSSETNGVSSPGTITTLPLLVSRKLGATSKGNVMLSLNLGYNISTKSDVQNYLSASTGLGLPLFRHLAIMGELSTDQTVLENNEGTREQLVKANIGFMAPITKWFLAYTSLGESLYSTDQKNHTYAIAGIRLLASGN